MYQKIVVFGATSAIAHETCKHFAAQGASFVLVGRNPHHLASVAKDLQVRGSRLTEILISDLGGYQDTPKLWSQVLAVLPDVDLALLAHGYLGDQVEAQASVDEAIKIFNVNTISYLALLTLLSNYFETTKRGGLAVITSVAGERGRKSNYVYGASKSAVICLLQGIRNRLHSSNIVVSDIRPGFIDTPMTKHLQKKPLVVSAAVAGRATFDGIVRKQSVIYVPVRWKLVMAVIKMIPEFLFKRLNL
jgi:short-subunit dehydrogenase